MITVQPARYAKKMMAVRCQSEGDFMTREMRLCQALNARYSGRERAYIMSPTKVTRLRDLIDQGYDACSITKALAPPQ